MGADEIGRNMLRGKPFLRKFCPSKMEERKEQEREKKSFCQNKFSFSADSFYLCGANKNQDVYEKEKNRPVGCGNAASAVVSSRVGLENG